MNYPYQTSSHPHMNVKTALYRHFNVDGELLYIGISLSAVGRLKQHMADKGWAGDIASVHIEHYPTRKAALDAEREAIISEKPLWNKTFNTERIPYVYDPSINDLACLVKGKELQVLCTDVANIVIGNIIQWDAGYHKHFGVVMNVKDFLGIPQLEVRRIKTNGMFGAACVVKPEKNPKVVTNVQTACDS